MFRNISSLFGCALRLNNNITLAQQKMGVNHMNMLITTSSIVLCQRQFSRFTKEEEEQFREIETWFQSFKKVDIPVDTMEKNFNRSSGPGGQNVNKVNSKAEVRFVLGGAYWIHPNVRSIIQTKFPRYMNTSKEFVITSEVHRTQKQNLEECVLKIYEIIKECCVVPSATSEQQKQKVEKLKASFDRKRLEQKKMLQGKKQDRKGGSSKYD